MADSEHRNIVHVEESGEGLFGQRVSIGRHALTADEPGTLGGKDTGPDPFELVMAGLGACTAMTIRVYARRKRWPLDAVRVAVRHARSTAIAPGERPHAFERRVTLEGPLDGEQRAALLKIADKCPVHLALEAGIDVRTVDASEQPD